MSMKGFSKEQKQLWKKHPFQAITATICGGLIYYLIVKPLFFGWL